MPDKYEEYRNLKKEKLSEKEIAEHFGLTRLELRRNIGVWKKEHKQTALMIRAMRESGYKIEEITTF